MSDERRIKRDNLVKFMDYDIDEDNNVLYMGSTTYTYDEGETGVDFSMAEGVIKGLHYLDAKATQGITIKMNNVGGDWYHGMAIYDAIKACKNNVTIIVYGHAMSMGSIILQAADHRILMPNATFMVHYGTNGYYGHSKNFDRWAEENKRINEVMLGIYLKKIKEKKPRFTKKQVKEICDYDTFLTAKETVDLGLADEVYDYDE